MRRRGRLAAGRQPPIPWLIRPSWPGSVPSPADRWSGPSRGPPQTSSAPTWTADASRCRIGSYRGPLLLCFLHVRCDGCEEFWRGLATGTEPGWPDALSAVAVTKGPDSVDRAEVARAATGVAAVPVVMSDRAWTDYRVTSYPFFALVDPVLGSVVGETVGFGWPEVLSMVRAHDLEG